MPRPMIKASLFLFLFFLLSQTAGATLVDQLIVVINGEPYTLSNLNNFAGTKMNRDFPSGDLSQLNDVDREVLEGFITEKLLNAEAREAGIVISDAEVDRYIEQVKKNNRLSDDDLRTVLTREGHTLASYRASIKAEMEKSEIIDHQVRRRVNISDDDVERYYKLNGAKFRSNERARISHILLALAEDAPPDQVKSVMARGQDLYRRIAAGEDFAALARQYSEGAGREQGGEIGWIKRGTLVAGIEALAFEKLSVGQVSEPLRTGMGVHLVKLEAREAGTQLPLSTVAPRIKEDLTNRALEERFARWLKTDLRRKHRVDVRLAGVVFKPEDSKEGTVDSLMAKSMRPARREERSMLSYLNPFSYIIKETPFEDDDPSSPASGKSVVSVFGVPLFTTDTADDVPDVLTPPAKEEKGALSTIADTLNPFSSKKP
jgi:peptidyl-prolyl cis-trans isomerase SurA